MQKNKKGFTLIELIVVIAVLAIIALLAVPGFYGIIEKSKEEVCIANRHIIYRMTQCDKALSETEYKQFLQENYNSKKDIQPLLDRVGYNNKKEDICPKHGTIEAVYEQGDDGKYRLKITCSKHGEDVNELSADFKEGNIGNSFFNCIEAFNENVKKYVIDKFEGRNYKIEKEPNATNLNLVSDGVKMLQKIHYNWGKDPTTAKDMVKNIAVDEDSIEKVFIYYKDSAENKADVVSTYVQTDTGNYLYFKDTKNAYKVTGDLYRYGAIPLSNESDVTNIINNDGGNYSDARSNIQFQKIQEN